MSSLHDLSFFVHNNPESKAQRSYAHAALNYRQRESVSNSFGLLPQGYCERKSPSSWKDDIQCSICIILGNLFKVCQKSSFYIAGSLVQYICSLYEDILLFSNNNIYYLYILYFGASRFSLCLNWIKFGQTSKYIKQKLRSQKKKDFVKGKVKEPLKGDFQNDSFPSGIFSGSKE